MCVEYGRGNTPDLDGITLVATGPARPSRLHFNSFHPAILSHSQFLLLLSITIFITKLTAQKFRTRVSRRTTSNWSQLTEINPCNNQWHWYWTRWLHRLPPTCQRKRSINTYGPACLASLRVKALRRLDVAIGRLLGEGCICPSVPYVGQRVQRSTSLNL